MFELALCVFACWGDFSL